MKVGKLRLRDLLSIAIVALALIFIAQGFPSGGLKAGWKTDFARKNIDLEQVISGGVGRDGIPPIDNPRFLAVAEVRHLSDKAPVIALELAGEARAYPLEALTRHEIVNDQIGDLPIAVTFCPLCNSALVFDRRAEGRELRFGVSGNLRHSDLIMWDDATESWWQQLTGEGIVGEYTGRRLDIVTSQLISFGVFRARYPAGKVLQGPLGDYGRNPYVGYDSSAKPFLFRGSTDSRLYATERVLAAQIDAVAVAYPFALLQESAVVNDRVADQAIVIFWQAGAASALDAAEIDQSRDVGMALMYSRELTGGRTLTFSPDDGAFRDQETGSRWNIFGEATSGPLTGEKLRQLNAYPHFWFAWSAFYPETLIGLCEPELDFAH